jgi:acyl carrier protein
MVQTQDAVINGEKRVTIAEALRWIATIFEEAEVHVKPETPRDEISTWDSLGVLTLMAGMDEKFGILLTDGEMRAMNSVGDILDTLQKHGKIE